ncbi:MAG: PKD domain-containing protein [Microthrixaceae bacterium]|nr:PKD domain-containing protein [Microthrixaceae bacterium]
MTSGAWLSSERGARGDEGSSLSGRVRGRVHGAGGGGLCATDHGGEHAPTASFTATPTSGVAPLTVGVDASASFDTGGSVATYAWNFGDGGTATGVTSTHEYTADGTFTITPHGDRQRGLTATTTCTVTVGVANVLPVAIAGADATRAWPCCRSRSLGWLG